MIPQGISNCVDPPGRDQVPQPLATLTEYRNYHRMLIGPEAAARCTASFTGTVLFVRRADIDDPNAVARGEVTRLDLIGYYSLVLASLTGLSSALGFTDTVDSKVIPERDAISCEVDVGTACIDLLQARHGGTPRLVRRFEYTFRLPGIHVVMLHFVTVDRDGNNTVDGNGNVLLHLVEQYSLSGLSALVERRLGGRRESFAASD